MTMKFQPDLLTFQNKASNDTNSYEVSAKTLTEGNVPFAVYLSKEESQMASHFSVNVCFKHISGLMKVAEQIEGQVSMAMETTEAESAVVFMFTKGRDF
jgi:hypothetical protein